MVFLLYKHFCNQLQTLTAYITRTVITNIRGDSPFHIITIMSKNSIGIIILLVIVLGGMAYFLSNRTGEPTPNTNATSTPPVVVNPPVTGQAKAPGVSIDAAAAPSNSTVVLSGSVRPNGAQTTYRYEYGKTSDFGARTSAQNIGSGYGDIPATGYITGLTPSTQYYYRLTATNAIGTANSATKTFTTSATGAPPTITDAPLAITNAATAVARTSASISGSINPKSSQTSYWFEYGTTDSLGIATGIKSAGSSGAVQMVSASINDLEPNTKYFFRVNAQNNFGTTNGAILSFTTDGPVAIAEPTVVIMPATGVGSKSASLHASVTANGSDTSYWFEYSTGSLTGSLLGTATEEKTLGAGAGKADVNASLTGLQQNIKYNYRIVAKNSQGTVRSEVMSFTTNSN